MVERFPIHARAAAWAVAALWLLATAAAAAQQPADALRDPAGDPIGDPISDSVVLVLKIISSTHARPATGLVLTRSQIDAPALVMVPAGFVSAGDEIVVLDGGTDILRDGRTARTVARSADAGVALLEVDGLWRPGVALNADAWPPAAGTMLRFEAWPAAEALAEGVPRTRTDIRLPPSAEGVVARTEPALPALSGPLFDRCGGLAGWHLSSGEPRIVEAGVLRDFAAATGFALEVSPCAAQPPAPDGADADHDLEAPEPNTEPAVPETSTASAVMDDVTGDVTGDEFGAAPSSRQRYGWVAGLAALVLVFVALALFLRRRGRVRGKDARLEGPRLDGPRRDSHDADGAPVRIPLKLDAQGQRMQVERGGVKLVFEKQEGRLLVVDTGDEAGPLALAVGGTPCLPGEYFYVNDGEEILISEECYTVRLGQNQEVAEAAGG